MANVCKHVDSLRLVLVFFVSGWCPVSAPPTPWYGVACQISHSCFWLLRWALRPAVMAVACVRFVDEKMFFLLSFLTHSSSHFYTLPLICWMRLFCIYLCSLIRGALRLGERAGIKSQRVFDVGPLMRLAAERRLAPNCCSYAPAVAASKKLLLHSHCSQSCMSTPASLLGHNWVKHCLCMANSFVSFGLR